jgi:tRNA-dihydrouridine synthase
MIMLRRHAELLVGLMGEPRGCADLRKHMAWYFKGFPVVVIFAAGWHDRFARRA